MVIPLSPGGHGGIDWRLVEAVKLALADMIALARELEDDDYWYFEQRDGEARVTKAQSVLEQLK